MLVEFKVSNFRSFKDEATFSMEPLQQNGAEADEPNVINTNLKDAPVVYRTSGIFGANASGKTNLLLALASLVSLVKNGAKMNLGDKFSDDRYALSNRNVDEPTSFFIKFIMNDTLYEYCLSLTPTKICKERLYSYSLDSKVDVIFNRSNVGGETSFKVSEGILQQWTSETLDNRIFLSEIVNNRNCQVKKVQDAYNWITDTLKPINSLRLHAGFSLEQISKGNGENIVKLVQNADLGLDNISVQNMSANDALERISARSGSSNDKKDEMAKIIAASLSKSDNILYPISFHKTEDGRLREFDFGTMESSGTTQFLALAGPILDILQNGYVLLVDELDKALHPYLVKYLVEMFNDPQINQNNAQLIFTSHAAYLMDGQHLSRDQVWFADKAVDKGFFTTLYSLSDFQKLKDKNISFYEAYMQGVYGAVPFLEKL